MANPTTEEIQLCQMLRDKVKDVLNDEFSKSDGFLVRWIHVKNGNLDEAAKMIRAAMQWRRDNNISDILKQPVNEFCATNFPYSLGGRDKLKRPLLTLPFGKWDLHKALSDSTRYEQFKIYILQLCEKLQEAIKKNNAERSASDPPVNQYTSIFNWEGFSFKTLMNVAVCKNLATLVGVLEANYPDSLGCCIFINCGTAISTFLGILKPVMSEKTYAKIKWYGTNRVEWQPAVLAVVDASQISSEFGGTKAV